MIISRSHHVHVHTFESCVIVQIGHGVNDVYLLRGFIPSLKPFWATLIPLTKFHLRHEFQIPGTGVSKSSILHRRKLKLLRHWILTYGSINVPKEHTETKYDQSQLCISLKRVLHRTDTHKITRPSILKVSSPAARRSRAQTTLRFCQLNHNSREGRHKLVVNSGPKSQSGVVNELRKLLAEVHDIVAGRSQLANDLQKGKFHLTIRSPLPAHRGSLHGKTGTGVPVLQWVFRSESGPGSHLTWCTLRPQNVPCLFLFFTCKVWILTRRPAIDGTLWHSPFWMFCICISSAVLLIHCRGISSPPSLSLSSGSDSAPSRLALMWMWNSEDEILAWSIFLFSQDCLNQRVPWSANRMLREWGEHALPKLPVQRSEVTSFKTISNLLFLEGILAQGLQDVGGMMKSYAVMQFALFCIKFRSQWRRLIYFIAPCRYWIWVLDQKSILVATPAWLELTESGLSFRLLNEVEYFMNQRWFVSSFAWFQGQVFSVAAPLVIR